MNTPNRATDPRKESPNKPAYTVLRVLGHYQTAEEALSKAFSLHPDHILYILDTHRAANCDDITFALPRFPAKRFGVCFIAKIGHWCAVEGNKSEMFDTPGMAMDWAKKKNRKWLGKGIEPPSWVIAKKLDSRLKFH